MNPCRKIAGLLLFSLALGGCVRYEETLQVNRDGSGTAAIVFSRPDVPTAPGTAQATLATFFDAVFREDAMKKGLPEGVGCEYKTTRDDGLVRTDIRYSFDDIHKFLAWAWAASLNSPFSNVSVVWKGGSLEYSRTFRPLEPVELAAVRANLPDGELVFRFRGPGALGPTDATKREGNTAIWEFKAPELLSGRTILAQYSIPGLSGLLPLYFVAGMALGLVAVFLILRWRRKRIATIRSLARPVN